MTINVPVCRIFRFRRRRAETLSKPPTEVKVFFSDFKEPLLPASKHPIFAATGAGYTEFKGGVSTSFLRNQKKLFPVGNPTNDSKTIQTRHPRCFERAARPTPGFERHKWRKIVHDTTSMNQAGIDSLPDLTPLRSQSNFFYPSAPRCMNR